VSCVPYFVFRIPYPSYSHPVSHVASVVAVVAVAAVVAVVVALDSPTAGRLWHLKISKSKGDMKKEKCRYRIYIE